MAHRLHQSAVSPPSLAPAAAARRRAAYARFVRDASGAPDDLSSTIAGVVSHFFVPPTVFVASFSHTEVGAMEYMKPVAPRVIGAFATAELARAAVRRFMCRHDYLCNDPYADLDIMREAFDEGPGVRALGLRTCSGCIEEVAREAAAAADDAAGDYDCTCFELYCQALMRGDAGAERLFNFNDAAKKIFNKGFTWKEVWSNDGSGSIVTVELPSGGGGGEKTSTYVVTATALECEPPPERVVRSPYASSSDDDDDDSDAEA